MHAGLPINLEGVRAPLTRVAKGDPITAKGWNELVEALRIALIGSPSPPRPWVLVKNSLADPIPPYSAFAYDDGYPDTSGTLMLEAAYGSSPAILTNGPESIAAGGYGHGYFIDRWSPVQLIASEILVPTNTCGPTSSSFEVGLGGDGLVAVSAADEDEYVWCVSSGTPPTDLKVVAQVTTEITARSGTTVGTGVVSLYRRATLSLLLTDEDVTVYNPYAATIAVDAYLTVSKDSFGDLWVVGGDCP